MPPPRAIAKTVSVKLDPDLRTRIDNLAEVRHRSAHWVMREAIGQYVEREEKREAFRQDTFKAWNEFQLTGLHATAEEADEWLDKLADGQDVEPPECHV